VELANKTIAASQYIVPCLRSACRIRKRGTGDGIVRITDASMRVRGFNGRPVDNETEQQKRQRTRKHAMRLS
jgi:hypothetical protein